MQSVDELERGPQVVAQKRANDVCVGHHDHLLVAVGGGQFLHGGDGTIPHLSERLTFGEAESGGGCHEALPRLELGEILEQPTRPAPVVGLDEPAVCQRRHPVGLCEDAGGFPAAADRGRVDGCHVGLGDAIGHDSRVESTPVGQGDTRQAAGENPAGFCGDPVTDEQRTHRHKVTPGCIEHRR